MRVNVCHGCGATLAPQTGACPACGSADVRPECLPDPADCSCDECRFGDGRSLDVVLRSVYHGLTR